MNIQGSIDLMKLEKVARVNVKGQECILIPIGYNDITVRTGKDGKEQAFLSLNVLERKEPSQYGHTHYVKQGFTAEYRTAKPQDYEEKKKVYLGDMKPSVFETNTQSVAPSEPIDLGDDLPF